MRKKIPTSLLCAHLQKKKKKYAMSVVPDNNPYQPYHEFVDLVQHSLQKADVEYLADKIRDVCDANSKRTLLAHELILSSDPKGILHTLFGYLCEDSASEPGSKALHNRNVGHKCCMSAYEWLVLMLGTKPLASPDHVRCLMNLVHMDLVPRNEVKENPVYTSGKNQWADAPPGIKHLLNLLDDALLDNRSVGIVRYIRTPRPNRPKMSVRDVKRINTGEYDVERILHYTMCTIQDPRQPTMMQIEQPSNDLSQPRQMRSVNVQQMAQAMAMGGFQP